MEITVGAKIKFEETVWKGSYPNAKPAGKRTLVGTVTKDSYGDKRGQHTFTIEIESVHGYESEKIEVGSTLRRKGRTLWNGEVSVLSTPENYENLKEEKHNRAKIAKHQKYLNWICEAEQAIECPNGIVKLDKIPEAFLDENPDLKNRINNLFARDLDEII